LLVGSLDPGQIATAPFDHEAPAQGREGFDPLQVEEDVRSGAVDLTGSMHHHAVDGADPDEGGCIEIGEERLAPGRHDERGPEPSHEQSFGA